MSASCQNDRIQQSLAKLSRWVSDQDCCGWDIYDGLNSPYMRGIKNPYLRILVLQINKYSPLNLRPLLKIQKGTDLKGMALFAQAYASLYNSTGDERYRIEMRRAIRFVLDKSLKGRHGYDCWASHYFPYISANKHTLSEGTPDIIGSSQAILALTRSYSLTKNQEEKDAALSAAHFLVDILFKDEAIPFFEYAKTDEMGTHITLNASAQAMQAISAVLGIEFDEELSSICEKSGAMLMQTQNPDGSWNYSIHRDGSAKRVQLDFHQGYIIDGLLAFLPYSHHGDMLAECIRRGADFYRSELFRQNGTGYYRHPLPFPIDIHNQAQGILTFANLGQFDEGHRSFAERILSWTVENMQDPTGYFYYQRWPTIVNKIPYMRWAQAWMLLAMARYLEYGSVNDD